MHILYRMNNSIMYPCTTPLDHHSAPRRRSAAPRRQVPAGPQHPSLPASPCASCARVHDVSQRHVALAKLVSPPPAVSLAVPAANGPGQPPRAPFVPAGCLAVTTRLFETVPLV